MTDRDGRTTVPPGLTLDRATSQVLFERGSAIRAITARIA